MTNWVNTVSRNHVERAVAGGFTQANHGKPHMLKRMRRGDGLVFYSPRTAYPDGAPLQAFTALGYVADDEPYPAEAAPGVEHWRRAMRFLEVEEAPIRPLIEDLAFIPDKSRWGYRFRIGVFEISDADFALIADALHARDATP
ncbi:EVE domain-containing protein [Microbacterium sp. CJ88]|uniref:EVE domain-containing protein n=1 Tax=Microbacterium sp. CJ88 TaxID=3445672 RepID=UPI003F6581D3